MFFLTHSSDRAFTLVHFLHCFLGNMDKRRSPPMMRAAAVSLSAATDADANTNSTLRQNKNQVCSKLPRPSQGLCTSHSVVHKVQARKVEISCRTCGRQFSRYFLTIIMLIKAWSRIFRIIKLTQRSREFS